MFYTRGPSSDSNPQDIETISVFIRKYAIFVNEMQKMTFLHRNTKKNRLIKKWHIQAFVGKHLKFQALVITSKFYAISSTYIEVCVAYVSIMYKVVVM